MKKLESKQRRSILKLLSIAGASGAIGPSLAATLPTDTAPPQSKRQHRGYRETEHIRQYYQSLED